MTDTLVPPAVAAHAPSTGRFTAITSEGGLLPLDLLDEVASGQVPHQSAADFGIEGRLADEIQSAFADARAFWDAFGRRRARPGANLTTLTREAWVGPLLERLGYDELVTTPARADGRTFAISHQAGMDEDAPPVHIVSFADELDVKGSHRRRTPHSAVQEALNGTDAVWGIATNGRRLRLLRDSAKLVKPSYLEFDLQGMIESNLYAQFAVFYRLLHRSRLPRGAADAASSPLEQLYSSAQERGGRVREKLRDGVEHAIEALGTGFLRDGEGGAALRAALADGSLTEQAYYRELLRLIYRLLFLMVAEERRLVADPNGATGSYERYASYFAVTRLRDLSEQPTLRTPAQAGHADLWPGLVQTFKFFGDAAAARLGGVTHLNGDLFAATACPHLEADAIPNGDLLKAISHLNRYRDDGEATGRGRGRRARRGGSAVWRRVNYAALDVEELGSVYESLLDLQPAVALDETPPSFRFVKSNERKSSGSYYTPPGLVGELVKSALDPVIAARLAAAGPGIAEREAALLDIKVCDPAAGSGHFLLAAARRLGRELARVRSEGNEPGADSYRAATRDVIAHCIYGVDLNPLAVELCKVALWLEAHEPGKPLGFLDHRVRHGNSLIGAPPGFDPTTVVIPDDAFKEVTGDDKATAKAARDKNKAERRRYEQVGKGQIELLSDGSVWQILPQYVETMNRAEGSVEDVAAKQAAFKRHRAEQRWNNRKLLADLWTAAYFWPLTSGEAAAPTTVTIRTLATNEQLWHYIDRTKNAALQATSTYKTIKTARRVARDVTAFHWDIEFEEVFARADPGFDCILGNPPWDQIQPEEQKFFAVRAPKIAEAAGNTRKQLIERLPVTYPDLAAEWSAHVRKTEQISRFIRVAERFPLTAFGKVNLYSTFAELFSTVIREAGRSGIIVPTGIATDDTNKHFFRWLVDGGRLASLYDFENRDALFPGVHRSYKFSLLAVAGGERPAAPFEAAFFLTQPAQLREPDCRFALSTADIALLNPNTRTCPIFRSARDAEITLSIYRAAPVLIRESGSRGIPDENPWGVTLKQGLFNLTSDSHLFRTRDQLEARGLTLGSEGRFSGQGEKWLPLYEAKMIHQFDHRFATYDGWEVRDLATVEHADPSVVSISRHWVREDQVELSVGMVRNEHPGWLVGFRDITNATNERTAIFSIVPWAGIGNSLPILDLHEPDARLAATLIANASSFAFDFPTRQKAGGTHLNFFIVKQLPVIPPERYTPALLDQIVPRVLELTYTAWDLEPFAKDCGYDGPPFAWDEGRRRRLRSELDGIYAHLYGLSRDDFAYILDTFPIVRRHDEAKYGGEFRTKTLCLEAYDWFNPETLSDLEGRIKRTEVALRALIARELGPGVARVPQVRLDRLRSQLAKQRASSTGSASPIAPSESPESLAVLLDASYLMDLKEILIDGSVWPSFEARFESRKQVERAFWYLNEVRNALAHTRSLPDETRTKGEEAVTWLEGRMT